MKKLLLALGFAFSLTMNAQVPSYVPTSGLVGYWSFTGNANDVSGNGNNGTNNGATLTTDRFGNANSCYSYNGVSSYINVPNSVSLQFNGGITISTWVNASQIPVGQINSTSYILSKGSDGGTPRSWTSIFDTNGTALGIWDSAGTSGSFVSIPQTTFPFSINNWYNIIYTFDGTTSKSYANGVLISSVPTTVTAFSNSYDLKFGRRHTTGLPYFFNGKIDDIGIWNRALTQTEITNLYQAEISCQSLVINSGTLSSFNPPIYQSTVTIYPNPANDHITIDCGTLTNVIGYHIEIVNTLGQVVFNQPMNTQQYYVALNTWSGTGIYFVKIYDASNNLLNTKKIILQ